MNFGMNKYYKYTDTDTDNVDCFLELDKEFYCLRAIYNIGKEYISTNLTIEDERYFLPEGSFSDSLEYMTETTEAEFLEKWGSATLPHLENWEKLKIELATGQRIQSKILCFYPQGIVCEIGKAFYGIANYNECESYFGSDKMCVGERLDLIISEFDNDNLWIKLQIQQNGN